MLPIWTITLASMVIVFLISYAIHSYYLTERHKENIEQIENVNFRTEKLKEYRDNLKDKGVDIISKNQ